MYNLQFHCPYPTNATDFDNKKASSQNLGMKKKTAKPEYCAVAATTTSTTISTTAKNISVHTDTGKCQILRIISLLSFYFLNKVFHCLTSKSPTYYHKV